MILTAEKKYSIQSPRGGVSMKGKVYFRAARNYWYVQWCDSGKTYKINKYKGFLCRDGELQGIRGEDMANRLLSLMRSDQENGVFRIEKFTNQSTDVIPFLEEWLQTQGHLSPATRKDYENSIKNHLIPWFKANPFSLHEVHYDVLCKLLKGINRSGKGKLNTMYCIHSALLYAQKSGKILTMPPFPEKRMYGIEPTRIESISEERQAQIINAIPEEHRPIFLWLKYHYRRPSEAMALHREDYDSENDCFIIRRTFSSKQLVQHTKTHKIHFVPRNPFFVIPAPTVISPYLFTHKSSRMEGKRYQHDFLVDLWNKAAESCGENIRMYAGLKHSSCTAFINEHNGSIDELQMLTDHARRDSVLKYAEVQLTTKRRLMAKSNIVPFGTKMEPSTKAGT